MSAPLRPSYESELEARIAELEAAVQERVDDLERENDGRNKAEARIAELEAEVARLQDADALNKTITSFNTQYYAEITKLNARIAELEAAVLAEREDIASMDILMPSTTDWKIFHEAIQVYRAAIRGRPTP